MIKFFSKMESYENTTDKIKIKRVKKNSFQNVNQFLNQKCQILKTSLKRIKKTIL